jgi:hypothetical protein
MLPSQQLNLEDHARSNIHLLGLFLYGVFFAFQVLSDGQENTEVVESCYALVVKLSAVSIY